MADRVAAGADTPRNERPSIYRSPKMSKSTEFREQLAFIDGAVRPQWRVVNNTAINFCDSSTEVH